MKSGLHIILVMLAALTAGWYRHEPPARKLQEAPLFFPPVPDAQRIALSAEGIALGKMLFYDPVLSIDSTLACAGCHQQEHAFADRSIPFSAGVHGDHMPRHTPPLFNLVWNERLFWDGRVRNAEEQVFQPIASHQEMDLGWNEATQRVRQSAFYPTLFARAFPGEVIDSTLIAQAIGQFLRSLISADSDYDKALRREIALQKEVFEGFVLANDQTKGNCLHCHPTDANALGTTGTFANNGLTAWSTQEELNDPGLYATTGKPEDLWKFKIPSLRNVAITAPYMHDGRFAALEEVLAFYSTGVKDSPTRDHRMGPRGTKGVNLTQEEQRKIILFLRALTDSSFLQNPEYAKPEYPVSSQRNGRRMAR